MTESHTNHRRTAQHSSDDETILRDRRGFLAGVGLATAALAGCIGDDDGDNGDDPNGDDNGAANGDDNGDDANGTPDNGDDDDTVDDDDDGTDVGEREFFELITWEDSFRFTFSDAFGSGEGRFDGGNMYATSTVDGEQFEMYVIDGTSYLVEGGECFTFTEQDPDETIDPFDPDEAEEDLEDAVVTHVGPDTIDGDSVDVYEVTYPETGRQDETFYLLSSGHLRRVVSGDSTTDFFDWGSVQSIEPPDMECMDFEDMFPGDDWEDWDDDFEDDWDY